MLNTSVCVYIQGPVGDRKSHGPAGVGSCELPDAGAGNQAPYPISDFL